MGTLEWPLSTDHQPQGKQPKMAARPTKPVDDSTYAGRFAARLRQLREKAKKTIDQVVSDMENEGYSVAARSIYSWERAAHAPPIDAFPALAKALGVKIRNLLPEE